MAQRTNRIKNTERSMWWLILYVSWVPRNVVKCYPRGVFKWDNCTSMNFEWGRLLSISWMDPIQSEWTLSTLTAYYCKSDLPKWIDCFEYKTTFLNCNTNYFLGLSLTRLELQFCVFLALQAGCSPSRFWLACTYSYKPIP